jgi:hypothetical protein
MLNLIIYLNENSSTIKDIIGITQGLVIIIATIFTAHWTYRTFAHREKISELKEFKNIINLLYWKMKLFCAQIRASETPDDSEIMEKMELAKIHNKLISISNLNLYTKLGTRKKILEIVGKWVSNPNINIMQQRNKNEKEKNEAWNTFNQQYEEVKDLIDEEAGKII